MNEGINSGDRGTTALGKRKEGFADVARWISLDSDSETSIYRRFHELGARNLLYLQAELLVLEKKLNELDEQDVRTDDMDLKDAARTWEVLTQRHAAGLGDAKDRIELIEKIQTKLREYHEALLLQSEISKLKRPNKRVLDAYRLWFKKPYPALGGLAKTFLDTPEDLVGLNTSETDYLSLFLRRHWPTRGEFSRDGLHRIGRFSEQSVAITVAAISIVVAAFLLVGSIVGLYWVTSDAAKLGMVAVFTATFALSVGLMTNAKRAEIFAAAAAYAAVLVVFVSGNISNPGA
ncbi:hypothetical protein CONLIGDRAFT_683493 [Coniochaeta ligniaria NRRL 30616]|uniref:DUF6594 domain-containing protein n=1 Tax=Coniochaeta ligniaria NRRL 30616 TaxID=1408157 RepID=A0A1J7IFP7_9PEZI|nr:hypothetical protein CONLIGDRAFT_683493 [Coniochaeta ligniaria NRRL 30616]